jgi:hypothetical protein
MARGREAISEDFEFRLTPGILSPEITRGRGTVQEMPPEIGYTAFLSPRSSNAAGFRQVPTVLCPAAQ